MKEDTYTVIIATADTVGQKFMIGMTHAKAMLMNGEMVKLSVGPADDPIGVKQRGFLHASVLPQIAEQAYVGPKRERYVAETWKQFFHQMYIPKKFVLRKVPRWDPKLCRLVQPTRATPHEVRVSSEEIGVRRYSEWIDQIIDYAVAELGVTFVFKPSEREGVRHVDKPRREKQQ